MLEVTRTGDWNTLTRKLKGFTDSMKTEVERATAQSGEAIVTEIVKRFEEQGPGWKGHGSWRHSQLYSDRIKRLTYGGKYKLTRKELVARSEKLGIVTRENMTKRYRLTKRQLAGRLAAQGNQILIDTGALMSSAKFKLISWDHGRVGMNRKQRGGNLALIHEFGAPRKKIPARPFFTPAFEKTKPKIIENYAKAIERAIGK